MILWGTTIGLILLSYGVTRKYENSKKAFLWLSGIIIVLVLGSRYFINGFVDEITYNYQYQGYSKYSFEKILNIAKDDRDWGFTLFYWAIAKIVPYQQFPIYFITGFFIFSSFHFIYYNAADDLLAVLLIFALGIFSFYMAGYRQCFAMCFCLFAFEYAKKKKLFSFLILCFIAITMHVSSFFFLLLYPLINIKNDKSSMIKYTIMLVTIVVLMIFLVTYASELFDRNYTEDKQFSLIGFLIQIVIMLVPIMFYLLGLTEKHENDEIFFRLIVLGLIIYFLKLRFFSFERLSYYYTFFTVAAFGNTLTALRKNNNADETRGIIKIISCILLLALIVWRAPSGLEFFWNC